MRTRVREVFAVAAQTYDRGNPLLLVERDEMGALLPPLGGLDVLDLGAGRGHYARMAATLGARSSVALDATPEMLRDMRGRVIVGDALCLPLRGACFDVAIAALVVSYLSGLRQALAEIGRVLRQGGILALSDLHPVARELGWNRSFASPSGGTLDIEAMPPTLEELREGLSAAGLVVERVSEARIDERLRGAFREAGRKDYEELHGTPLLLLLRARKGDAYAP